MGVGSSTTSTPPPATSAYEYDDLFVTDTSSSGFQGSGAFGDVRKCTPKGKVGEQWVRAHMSTKDSSAPLPKLCVKNFRKKESMNETNTIRELNLLSSGIVHPHILQCFGVFRGSTAASLPCVVLELAEGVPDGPILQKSTASEESKVSQYGGRGDFFRYITGREPMSQDVVRFVAYQMASGIYRLHHNKDAEGHAYPLIHRDIKPENTLCMGEIKTSTGLVIPVVKIADFGTSRLLSDSSTLVGSSTISAAAASNSSSAASTTKAPGGAVMTVTDLAGKWTGSVQYIASEMMRAVHDSMSAGHGYISVSTIYDGKVDLYSLGVSMFFMLTGGVLPYGGHTEMSIDLIESVLKGGVMWKLLDMRNPHVSEETKAIISQLITADPAKRLSARAFLAHEWFDPIRAEVASLFKDPLLLSLQKEKEGAGKGPIGGGEIDYA